MTITPTMEVVKAWDKTVASRSLPFDAHREAANMMADPDNYSMSHLDDEQVTAVLTLAYSL